MRRKRARRTDASRYRGSVDSAAKLRDLSREITRKQSEIRSAIAERKKRLQAVVSEAASKRTQPRKQGASASASSAAQRPELDKEITPEQSEIRAAKTARRAALEERLRAEKLETARQRERVKKQEASASAARVARRPEPDKEVAPEQSEIRAAKTAATEQVTEGKISESESASPVAADAGSAPANASGLGRRIALGTAVVAVASVSGLLAGSFTENDAGATLTPDRAKPATVDYEKTLDREVETLAAARTAELKQLRDAQTRARQAAASEDLAAVHRRAARSLARASAPASLQAPNESLVTTLRRLAGAYRRLATAAATRNPTAYGAGQATVRRAEARLQQRLRALRAL